MEILYIDQLNVDIYRRKEQRASSYIDLPDFLEMKFGLVNIPSTCDDECFQSVHYLSSERED